MPMHSDRGGLTVSRENPSIYAPFALRTLADGDKLPAGVIGRIRGVANTTSLNSYGFKVAENAFDESLQGLLEFPQLLWNHDWGKQIGKITAAYRDGEELIIEADIADTSLGRDALTLIQMGALRAFSVGFMPQETAYDREKKLETVTRGELQEVSAVGRPANKDAVFAALSACRNRRKVLRPAQTTAPVDPRLVEISEATTTLSALSEVIRETASVLALIP